MLAHHPLEVASPGKKVMEDAQVQRRSRGTGQLPPDDCCPYENQTQHTTTLRVGHGRHGATCLHGKDRGPSHSQPAATGSRL